MLDSNSLNGIFNTGTIANSGTITIQNMTGDGIFNDINAIIDNSGTITISNTGFGTNGIFNAGTINNSGTIDNITGGTFDNNNGTINNNCDVARVGEANRVVADANAVGI